MAVSMNVLEGRFAAHTEGWADPGRPPLHPELLPRLEGDRGEQE
jgi:hypothetical protein